MNIDPYYAKGSGAPRPQFGSPSMSAGASRFSEMSPSFQMADQPQMQSPYPYRERQREMSPDDAQRQQEFNMRLFGLQNNAGPDEQTMMNRAQRDVSNALYNNFPRPALGAIDRNTSNAVNQIYYRHYLQGTYGSPEMMEEIRVALEMAPPLMQQAPDGSTVNVGVIEGMSTPGTDVVDVQYIPKYRPPPTTPVNFQQGLADLQARRASSGLPPLKGMLTTPTIGGPGGLPGRRM